MVNSRICVTAPSIKYAKLTCPLTLIDSMAKVSMSRNALGQEALSLIKSLLWHARNSAEMPLKVLSATKQTCAIVMSTQSEIHIPFGSVSGKSYMANELAVCTVLEASTHPYSVWALKESFFPPKEMRGWWLKCVRTLHLRGLHFFTGPLQPLQHEWPTMARKKNEKKNRTF